MSCVGLRTVLRKESERRPDQGENKVGDWREQEELDLISATA